MKDNKVMKIKDKIKNLVLSWEDQAKRDSEGIENQSKVAEAYNNGASLAYKTASAQLKSLLSELEE